jgi:transaldolase / glucose-6-phosphate isomerase
VTLPAPALPTAAALTAWDAEDRTARLWRGDASLWTDADEASWLGWLDLGDLEAPRVAALQATLSPLRDAVTSVLLLGMGGSSLGAEVMAHVLPRGAAGVPLRIVDTLEPTAVRDAFAATDWRRTLVVVASKSGGTLEPAVLLAMARAQLAAALGPAGVTRVVAITDPGSALEAEAREAGFGALLLGRPSVGGRFSVLSPFGLVPALLLDAPVEALAQRARAMAEACRAPAAENPGVQLGLAIAEAARAGRDKLTLRLPPALSPLGAWIEQLVAESLGKRGQLVLPVVDEAPSAAWAAADRCVVDVTMPGAPALDAALRGALAAAGVPLLTWSVEGPDALWAECFRWEFATAVAGSRLGLHPFDQPDVEASKVAARGLTAAWERDGVPAVVAGLGLPPVDGAVAAALADWADALRPGEYAALLAWLPMTPPVQAAVARLREAVGARSGCATTVGFGPRYLHSTGQAFKGGPDRGAFLSVSMREAPVLAVPGRTLPLAAIARAQREGEIAVLRARGRRVLELVLEGDPVAALEALTAAVGSPSA